jgi:hypothetical protein
MSSQVELEGPTDMCDKANQEEWRKRFTSVAKAQGRYLWLLSITGVFYLAIDRTVSNQAQPSAQNLPLLGIELDGKVVWASGSLVLSLIGLAALGAITALTHAYSKANPDSAKRPFESMDTEPTAIDLIVYSPTGEGLWPRLTQATYPLWITIVFGEAVWLWLGLLKSEPYWFWDGIFLVLGGAGIIFWFFRLIGLWRSKIRKMIRWNQ